MVLEKRLDYGFNGYEVPAIPRGSRSARRKGSARKKNEGNQMCAFELLATVAGKLLLEKDISPVTCNVEPGKTQENGKEFKKKDDCYKKNGKRALLDLGPSLTGARETIKQEPVVEKLFKVEPCDQVSSDESVLASGAGSQRPMSCQSLNYSSKEYSHAQDDGDSRPISRITNPDSSEHAACAEGLIFDEGGSKFTSSSAYSVFSKLEVLKTMPEKAHGKCGDWNRSPENLIDRKLVTEEQRIRYLVNGTTPDMCSSEESMKLDTQPNALVSSDSSVDIPLCDEYITCNPFPNCRDDVKKVVSRDDDENSSGCTQRSTISVKAFRPSCLGNRKIRKMLSSEFWKAAPTLVSSKEICNTDMEVKPVFHSGKACYTRQRTQRCSPSKRRKLFERNSIATSDKGIVCEDIFNSPEKCIDGEAPDSSATTLGASDPSSPVVGTKSSFKSDDSHVKLSIKSFGVPELFIEMPETATVATLKKTVMEAVTSILGDGLRVGVLLQGKKIRDDEQTLIQTGISEGDKLDSLGFMLEPKSPPMSSLSVLSSPETQPITRYPTVTPSGSVVVNVNPGLLVTSSGGWSESDHDSVLSPTADLPLEKRVPDSRALVALPTVSMEALAVVPIHRKLRRAELVQRRMRRPFSVSEVEALVQAVEKLGTGRWRDVKLRAFDNAKHRTYVDLKDKWKTLVHTASISPQQRRGEAVPEELLERVLSAHAYWSQQQAKQQAKQQADPLLASLITT